ncbi:hypothetical protein [Dickeya lacustris]|uniref:hypothetical protein n=1 Tax=Dickeya lacustris TaxID=2259638 RepID=UPI0022BA68F6|nr:hypothetical protein [Dickeya lacustris]
MSLIVQKIVTGHTLGFAGFGFLVFLGQHLAGPSGALTASIMMATMPMLGLLTIWALKKTALMPAPSALFCSLLAAYYW